MSLEFAFTVLTWLLFLPRTVYSAECPDPESLEAKVFGGAPAPCGRYPHAVSIRDPDDNAHICGGVLIDPQWVLTTDTCLLRIIVSSSAETVPVAIGQFILGKPGGEVISARPVRISDGFATEPLSGSNIGLLKLQKRSKYQPINLARSQPPPGSVAVLVGWGRLSARGGFARALNEAGLAVLSKKACQAKYAPKDISNFLCAGRELASCAGDEGSPLLLPGGSASGDTVVGIALDGSRIGVSCGDDKPGLFVAVSSHLEWINGKIRR
ncbi:hypothetical protein BSKO_13769 [Bryopsis sp. KO-2023]|nr:hypothetical protein BSKO_13769 [Bryopsis sp. KO-2023]